MTPTLAHTVLLRWEPLDTFCSVEREPLALALEIARCPELASAQRDTRHPCSKIVNLQSHDEWQVPEAWAGAIATAKILFLSSNPSISEDLDGVW